MPKYTTADIRNLALVGHAGSGKTILTEAILHKADAIGQLGEVEKGTTVSDFDPLEKEFGHSLASSVVSVDYRGKHINLIDTPGSPDFMGHALASFPAVETVAVLINAQAGIETVTRRIMERAKARELCRVIVINKIDAENLDLAGLVEQIQETFGKECLPINLPTGNGSDVIDILNKAEGESDFSSVEEAHTALIDQIVEVDEALMETYLEQGEVSPEQLHAPFEKALREGHLVPIFFTSGKNGVGIEALLAEVVSNFPSPSEGNPRTFLAGDDEQEIHGEPDPDKPALAHVFKVLNDRFGKVCVFRVHQGTITKDTPLFVGNSRKPLKLGHIYKLQGENRSEVDSAIPGDLACVVKIEEIDFDDALRGEQEPQIHLKPIKYPLPMQGYAIDPKKRGDETKIGDALNRLCSEDPCFVQERNAATKELVIRGLGEMHLRVILRKLNDKYGVEVDTRPPKIAYRETILAKAEGHHRHKKQSGGAGQFGEVYLRVEPLERDAGFEFVNDTFGGSIPSQFLPAVEKGCRGVLETGAIAGYPIQDVRVSVYDGKHHPVDSKEVAFVTAGRRAFIDAFQKAKPVLLEPVVHAEITVPDANMGDITGDLSGKRGRIQGTDSLPGGMCCITGIVPLAEMTNYQSQLKSVTGGQGSFTMELSHYEPVPPQVQQQIVAQFKPKEEED